MTAEKPKILNDYIFKKIFSKKGNESILKDFLIGILEIPIEKVETKAEVSLEKQLEENKLGRLDILATLDDKTIVNIEVQIINQYNFIERTLYYWSGVYYNELKAGKDYTNSKRTIAINILDYELFEEGPYHEVATLRREYKNTVLTDKIEFHFIQIPKFLKENIGMDTKLEEWMHYISQKSKEGVMSAMEKNKEIKKANDEYEYLTGDEAERRLAFLREKAIRDERNNLEGSRKEGFEIGLREGRMKGKMEGKKEGRKEGIRENKIEIAKNMLKEGMEIELISKLTELTADEIKKIKNS